MKSKQKAQQNRLALVVGILFLVTSACQALTGPAAAPTEPSLPPSTASEPAAPASSPVPTRTAQPPEATQPAATLPGSTRTEAASSPGETQESPASGGENAGKSLLAEAAEQLPDLQAATRYTITVQVDFAAHRFQGSQQVQYTNTEDAALEGLYFRLLPNGRLSYGNGSLNASQVQVGGEPVETEVSQDETVLVVPLADPLAPGAQVLISMEFEGEVPLDFGGAGTEEGYGIYNFTDGVLSMANWYPILAVYDQDGWNLDPVSGIGDSVYSDVSFYSVDLTAPSQVQVATTGVTTRQAADGDLTRYHLESGPVRDFFMVFGQAFEVVSGEAGGTTVKSYYLPGDRVGGQRALEVAVQSVELYNERIGLYPYAELDVVGVPMRYAAGVEYPGLILIGGFLYGDSSQPFFPLTVAHEVAHQWWYNLVGNDVFDAPWLDEGLTTFTSALYFEGTQGVQGYEKIISFYQDSYDQIEGLTQGDAITDSLRHFETEASPQAYSGIVYSKSALFFAALREEIGDEAFFQGLQSYFQEYRFRIATSANLLTAFEEAAGRDLDAFYTEWLD